MGNLNDFQGFNQTLRNERRSLEELCESGEITEADAAAIDRFLKNQNGIEVSTMAEYLKRIQLTAKRADTPLTDMTHDNLQDILFAFRHGDHPEVKDSGFQENTMRNYRKALRIFFTHLDRDWADDINVGAPVKTRISEDDILDTDDIEALVQASQRARDTALVEFMADTGARLSMVGSLRLADLSLDGDRAYYTPNPDASGLKGAPQHAYPVIDSKASLRTYVRNAHPQPDNSEAAVFHKLTGFTADEDAGALTPQHLSRILKDLAAEAEIEKPVNPHSFRHAAISRMYREGYTKQQIQHRVSWKLDTDMWERYVHLTAEDMNDQIYAEAGVIDESDAEQTTRERCGNCNEMLAPYHRYCGNCGEPATPELRDLQDEAEDAIVDDLSEEEDEVDRELLKRVYRLVKANPHVLEAD